MRWNQKKYAKMGGKARAEKLTPEERREISRRGGLAARGKPRKKYKRKKKKTKKSVKRRPR